MKKHLITLFVVILATLTHAADLESQLPGYWAPNTEKTIELAKQENREVGFLEEKIMPKMTWEFQPGKMMVHIRGNQAENPPELFTIKTVDESSNTLVLEFKEGKPERRATINGDLLTLRFQKHTIVMSRISKEAFESRFTPPPPMADDITKEDIPATPAKGSVHGVSFTVETATLSSQGNLELRQGEGFFPDQAFGIFILGSSVEELAGKTILVKPNRRGEIQEPHISLKYKVEGSTLPESEDHIKGYSMKLQFGTVSDGKIPGKIHLRLPDDAKSFVIGTFTAEMK